MSRTLPATFVKGFHNEELVRRMEYRKLGGTNLKVSKIALGGATLSALFDKKFDEEEGIRTVQEAIKSGINYIDTAPFYGQGQSEQVLGKALMDVPREAYYIATKVGRYELEPERMFDFSAAKTRESVKKSLGLLGLDYVDVLQVHDVDAAPSLDLVLKETIPVLEEFVKAGKARFIGITGYDVDVLKECAERAQGRVELVLTYARYTLLDNSLVDYLDFFKSQNLGIICAAAHALGLLTNAGPQPWHPAPDDQKATARQAAEVCIKQGVQLGKLAMYYTSRLRDVSTFLVGNQTRQLLHTNLTAFYHGLSQQEQEVLQHLRENVLVKSSHWEGIELERYWAAMKKK
ncbi:L-galactose dehydrogenase isoform X1 [Drosophila navojoa]|uniref:L-galactose dehydrogenase isoform X1 n=1 Tax=Drosophila navojoa TaxID=7232 RepID=UPI0011BFADA8|nr:L-galactose dehydrogenase isoform X1 [Drosophila navojoa]